MTKVMRLAVVTPSVNPRGGTEKCLSWLIEDLSPHCNLTVFAGEVSDTDSSRCRVVKLPMIRHPRLLRYLSFLLANTLALILTRVLGKRRFDLVLSTGADCLFSDVVYAHFCCAAWSSLLDRDPLALPSTTMRQRLRNLHYRLFLTTAARVEGAVYRSASLKAVLAVSTGTKAELVRHHLVQPAKVIVVPNAVDERVRIPAADRQRCRREIRERYGIPETAMVLLFVAAGDWKRKGLLLVVKALALLADPRVHLLVLGREDIAFYREEARRAGCAETVHFAGFTPAIERHYAAADIFVYPSRYEAFSLVSLEAAAAGLPLVVTRINGTEDLVREGENGLFVQLDEQDIAAKLRALRTDAALVAHLSAGARRSSLLYTRSAVVERTLDVCASLLPAEVAAA